MRATPAVRALAQRLGVDINTVEPASSPAGNITAEDVEKAAYTSPLGEEAETLRGVRKTYGQKHGGVWRVRCTGHTV